MNHTVTRDFVLIRFRNSGSADTLLNEVKTGFESYNNDQPRWKPEYRQILENLPDYIDNILRSDGWDTELNQIEVLLFDLDCDGVPELNIQFRTGASGVYCGSIIIIIDGINSRVIIDKQQGGECCDNP